MRTGSSVALAVCLTLLPAAAAAPPLPRLHPGSRGHVSAVLMWHDVVARKKEVWFDTTVAELEGQFEAIRKQRLTPIPLDRLADHLEKGAAVPPGAVVLTFDDNNLGLYRHLFPMLQRCRWPAAFFVHTDYVGRPTGKEHCSWAQLREMERSGLVKVYPHTASHPPDLRKVPDRQFHRELVAARQVMEKQLGGDRPCFAYTDGKYDERVARAVWKAGYRLGITEDRGAAQASANLMMVRRYSMHRRPREAIESTARAMRGAKRKL
jgi:poly-beta-1,6-N-acetyl-D-glucosamine N-deacetylase